MKTVNEMKLCVPSKSCNEAFARCVVSAFVMSLDPTVNELSDLKTAAVSYTHLTLPTKLEV